MSFLLPLFCLVAAPWPDADTYLAAHWAESAGKYGDAAVAYGKCAGSDSPLAPYARVREACCRAKGGDLDGGLSALESALSKAPDGPWVRMAKAERAALLAKRGQRADASTLYADVLSVSPKLWWLDQYAWQAAENNLAIPANTEQAYSFYRNVLTTTRRRDPRIQAAEKLCASTSVDDRLAAIAAFLRCGANKEAAACIATTALESLDGSEQTARWQYLMGRVLLAANQAQKGRELLGKAIETAPTTSWARLSLSHIARSYLGTEAKEPGMVALTRLTKEYPDTEETGDTLWWYAERQSGSKTPKEAIASYLKLASNCPSHERADDAQLAAGLVAKRLGLHADALRVFAEFETKFPASPLRSEALFWSGRIREGGGDVKGARENYAQAAALGLGNYYGHRALERAAGLGDKKASAGANLAVDGKRSFLRPFPGRAEAPKALPAELVDDPRCVRLRFFAEHGLEEAEWEALDSGPALVSGDGMAEAWYQFLAESGLAFTGSELADAAGWGLEKGQPTPARLRLTYARAYWPVLEQVGKDAHVDPFLIAAVARQESTFRPALSSPAGARGVMQIMPSTAKWIVKGNPSFTPEDAERLEDPGVSLRMGADYLADMIARNGNNLVYALASYNAGPGNVAKWRKANSSADLEAFIEAIPFAETRDYVKRVLGNYAAYHSLYPAAN